MNSLEKIALSKIATLITRQSFFLVSDNSVWNRILSNCGHEELYEEYSKYLNPYSYNGIYRNENIFFGEHYLGVKEIFKKLYNNKNSMEELLPLLESIVEEIKINFIVGDLESVLEDIYTWENGYKSIEEHLKSISVKSIYDFFEGYESLDFKEFKNSLKVLNLDLEIVNEKNKIKILLKRFAGTPELEKEKSKLSEWLNGLDKKFEDMYEEALKNYIEGNVVSTISSCRNLITGLFTLAKDNETKWLMGLKKVSTDKNIENISNPSDIINKKLDNNKYPRFKIIYYLYSLASDLGAHALEAPKIDGEIEFEDVTLSDAHLVLRMTEDALIWVMESKRIEEIKKIKL